MVNGDGKNGKWEYNQWCLAQKKQQDARFMLPCSSEDRPVMPGVGILSGNHRPTDLIANPTDVESFLRGTGSIDHTGSHASLDCGDARIFREGVFVPDRPQLIEPLPLDLGPATRPTCRIYRR